MSDRLYTHVYHRALGSLRDGFGCIGTRVKLGKLGKLGSWESWESWESCGVATVSSLCGEGRARGRAAHVRVRRACAWERAPRAQRAQLPVCKPARDHSASRHTHMESDARESWGADEGGRGCAARVDEGGSRPSEWGAGVGGRGKRRRPPRYLSVQPLQARYRHDTSSLPSHTRAARIQKNDQTVTETDWTGLDWTGP